MKRIILLVIGAFFFATGLAVAQPTFVIQNKKDACDGLANGSFEVLVTAANAPPLRVFVFGPPDAGPINATVGVPVLINNLPGTAGGKTYLVIVQDADGSSPFFVTIFSVSPNISASLNTAVNNSNCSTPDGSIDIDVSGGTGSYSYAWTGPNGFTATTQDISSLAGGTYNVTVFDNGTNCSRTLAPVTITDPSPAIQNVTTPSPQVVCAGDDATIALNNTEPAPVNYEVMVNGSPTGITQPGTGGAISFTIPSGTFANGDVLTIRAVNGACTPVNMNGVVIVNVVPLPVPSLSGLAAVCQGTTGVVYTTDAGQTNYVWTVSAGGTITAGGGATNNTVTVTWNTAGAQSVSVNYTNSNGCTGATPTVLPVTVNALPVPTVSGSNSVCQGATGVVYSTEAGQSNYVWNVSAGGTITAGGTAGSNTVTVTWNTTGAQTVSVNYTNAAGCTATSPTVLNVNVNALPVPTLGGSTSVCVGATGVVYTTEAGRTNYVWNVSAGGTITAGGTATDNTVTVTWNTAGAQTVSVSYTDANGCSPASPTVSNVTVNPVPTPTLSGATTACAGTTGVVYTTEAGQNNYVWTVSAGGTITAGGGATDNTVTVTWNTAGAQTVQVNYQNAFGCPAPTPATRNVTVNPLPVPTLSGNTTVCAGATGNVYTTEAGQSNYVWTVSAGGTITAGGTATSNTVTVTWNTAGAQTVTVSYTDANGCSPAAPAVRNVTVNAPPAPTIAGPATACTNVPGQVYTTEAGMTNYVWTISGGGTITAGGTATDNTVTVTWTGAGARFVRVNYTNPAGCTASAPTQYNVTVSASPVPTFTTGPTSVCVGATGVTYTTQNGRTNYVWTVSAGGTITAGGGATNNFVTVTWHTAGAQSVSVSYTTAAGCTALVPSVRNVTVHPLPVPTLAGLTAVCEGQTGVVYTTEAGMTNYIWSVSAGGTITAGGTAGSNTVTVTWNTAGPQTVSVSYTNGNGCSPASPTVSNVTVSARPTPTITGPASACVGTTGVVYSTEAGQSNYVWAVSAGGTITAGGTATDNTVTVTWSTAGPQTVSVNYQNASGCAAASPTVQNVTVNALPVATLSGATSSCVGTTGVVYTTEAGRSNYIWTVSAGGTITAGGGATDNTVTVTWNTAGAQNVTVTYTDANGCAPVAPVVRNVTVNPLPTPGLAGPVAVCQGQSGVVYTTEAGQSNYVWTVSAGGTITAGGTATSNTVTVTWNTAGAQTVTVNYTDASGCTAMTPTVANVTVNTAPTPTITGPASVCVGTTGVVYSTEAGQSNYVWAVSAGGTITAGGTATDNTVTVTWGTAGPQTVSVNYTSSGCSAASPTVQNVTVNALPVATLSGATSSCVGTTGVVYTTEAGQSNYVWTVSAGGTITAGGGATDNTVTVTWNTAGAQTVTVTYTDANGCAPAAPVVRNVTVNPLPTPGLAGPVAVCQGQSGVVYTTEAGQSNYVWTVSAGGTITAGGTATSNTVTVTWNTAGAQTVTVNYTDASGCTAMTPTVANVTVNTASTPTITGPASVCVGTTGVVYSTEAGQSNYAWTVSAGGTITAGGTATDNTVTVTWGTAGPQTVSVNYTSSGCSAASPTVQNVTVNALPVATLSGATSSCVGTTGVVYTTEAGQSNYVWTVSAGGTITAGGGATDNTVTVTWNTAGAQNVTVNYTDANGCAPVAPVVRNVTVNPLPTPGLTGTVVVCQGQTGVIYSTDAGQSNYVWTVSAGGTITAGGTATDNTVTVTWNTAGAQTVTVNYTDASGCTATTPTVANVTVNAAPTPTLTGSALECEGATGIVYSTEAGQNNYVWTVSAGGTITAGGTATDNTVTITWNTAGAQTVSVNYENASGCTAASATVQNVTVNPAAIVDAGAPQTICAGSNVTLTGTRGGGATSSSWSTAGDGVFNNPFLLNATYTPGPNDLANGSVTLTLATNDPAGPCPAASDNVLITISNGPNAGLTVGVTINPVCTGGVSGITVDNSEVGFNYQLRNDAGNSLVGAPVAGTGGTITLSTGALAATTTFNVLVSAPGCTSVELTTLATVNVTGTINAGFTVTPASGTICEGGSTNIQLSGSENGVMYQLRNDADDSPVGAPVAGNGSPINLPTGALTATTTFNILASNGTCSIQLTNTATVNVDFIPDAGLTVGVTIDPVCTGGSSVITIAGSEVGVSYQLRNDADDSNIGAAVTGTGGTINLPTGPLAATTTFNILASNGACTPVELTTLPTVNVSGAINAGLTVTSAASPICQGSSTNILVAGSQVGVTYQLRNDADDSNIGAPVAGDGGTINLFTGNLNATTTFNILASNGTCSIELTETETVTIDVNPNPALAVGATINPVCTGGISGVTVAGSQVGVTYQLRNDADDSNVGSPVNGTGGMIELSTGVLNTTTTFNVLATSGVCPAVELTQVVTINVAGTINAGLNVIPSVSPICAGQSTFIQVEATESGVTYQLRRDADNSLVGASQVGTGGTLMFATGNLGATTTFNILASNAACSIELTDLETITVNPSPNANLPVAAVPALICSNTSSVIQITGSENGVTYQLRLDSDNSPVGGSQLGNGGTLSFPTGNLTVNTTFNVLASSGSCSVTMTSEPTVTIRPIGDPACGPVGGTCSALTTIDIDPVLPTCADPDGGVLVFNLPGSYDVTIEKPGDPSFPSQTERGSVVTFDLLQAGTYTYTIADIGVPPTVCVLEREYVLPKQTEVVINSAYDITPVTCFGGNNGNLRLDVSGTKTGKYFFTFVNDGVESTPVEFTPGALLPPPGLTANDGDQIIIKVDDNALMSCPDTVRINMPHQNAKLRVTLDIEEATCFGNDGSVAITSTTGGSGSGYQYSMDGGPFGAGPFENLLGGSHTLTIRDGAACEVDTVINVTFPGSISYNVFPQDATCDDKGKSGRLIVQFDDAGTYEIGITTNGLIEPDTYTTYTTFDPLNDLPFEVDTLARGTYYVYVKTSGVACPTRRGPFNVNGVYAVDFAIEPAYCNDGYLSLQLANMQGDPDPTLNFELWVWKQFNNDPNNPDWRIFSIPLNTFTRQYTLDYNDPQNEFLRIPGEYRFRLKQIQPMTLCGVVESDEINYTVPFELFAKVDGTKESYPDVPTGELRIGGFVGGLDPYTISIDLDSASSFSFPSYATNPEPVELSNNQQYEKVYENIPPGRYIVVVSDDNGCVIELTARVPMDTDIYIPNVFTPNDDGFNDVFFIRNLPLDASAKLVVTNRWGKEIFSSGNYQNNWAGEGAGDGVYFYRLQIGSGEPVTGWVEVMRSNKP